MEDIPTTANGSSPVAATANTPVESSSKNEQITELAMNLLVQGRRHLLVSDIPSAISALAESSRLLVELYGEFADECAESYYYYGMALLEMARTDCDVLGDAVEGDKTEVGDDNSDDDEENGDDEDEDGEGEDSEEEQDEDQMKEQKKGEKQEEKLEEKHTNGDTNGKNDEKSEKLVEDGKDDADIKPEKIVPEVCENKKEVKKSPEKESSDKTEDVEMKEEETSSEHQNGESSCKPHNGDTEKAVTKTKNESKGKSLKAPGSSTSEAKPENGDEEDISDDVSNLQLAWEVFELAKNIYQRKAETDPSAKPKLADALIRLAEVAIESENYTSAIDDLQKCLEIQKSSFPEDSRSLAETHYQLGVAYTFTTEFKEAVKSFEAAASVIQLRIENLKNPAEKKPSMEEPRNLFHTIEGEIEELETLLPDIREKITDTIDLEKEAIRKMTEHGGSNGAGTSVSADTLNGGPETESTVVSGESPNSSKPAMDITHLIRKKRKPEDGTGSEGSVAKKICPDAVVADAV